MFLPRYILCVLYAYNAVGSVVANTDQEGFVIRENDFDAYGNVVREQDWVSDKFPALFGGSQNDLLFSTKERDYSTGLDYFGFRYYDAVLGKFTTRDPSGYPDGPNNYLYCRNNPINAIDPLGLETKAQRFARVSQQRAQAGQNCARCHVGTSGGGSISYEPLQKMGNTAERFIKRTSGAIAGLFKPGMPSLAQHPSQGHIKDPEGNKVDGGLWEKGMNIGRNAEINSRLTGENRTESLQTELKKEGGKLLDHLGTPEGAADITIVVGGAYIGVRSSKSKVNKGTSTQVDVEKSSSGVGEINYYKTDEGPHFTVKTKGKETIHTEQIITDSSLNTTHVIAPDTKPHEIFTFDLPNLEKAQHYQKSILNSDRGKYNKNDNSCLTEATKVLNEGGAELSTTTRKAIRDLKKSKEE